MKHERHSVVYGLTRTRYRLGSGANGLLCPSKANTAGLMPSGAVPRPELYRLAGCNVPNNNPSIATNA